jgi:cAMP phosphodiesterase
VKIQLLPSSFDPQGGPSPEQRFTCFLLDDCVAIDAGCLAPAVTEEQRQNVRDIIVTHPHMDHIASLPIFIDDLFATLEQPVRVYATEEIIAALERDIFNWTIYPRFSELRNAYGPVMEYVPVTLGEEFQIRHLRATPVAVNHIVPTFGLLVKDEKLTVGFSSDTAATEEFWHLLNAQQQLDILLIEASFPDELADLAWISRHFTPATLNAELSKLHRHEPDILVVHIKPAYREEVVNQLSALSRPRLRVMEPGRDYHW